MTTQSQLVARVQCRLQRTAVLARDVLEDADPSVKVLEDLGIKGVRVGQRRQFVERVARTDQHVVESFTNAGVRVAVGKATQRPGELGEYGVVVVAIKELDDLFDRGLSVAQGG